MIFFEICFLVKNREMLPHDRDTLPHDREKSFTSRALLGLTVVDNLGRSQAIIMTMTSCLTIVTMLTVDHHDRDSL